LSAHRFERQTCVPGVDQRKLSNASALVVGAGGLGSPVVLYLAGAGVGRVDVYDHDNVDETNLHRQILYVDRDVGDSKARIASARARDVGAESQPFQDLLTGSSNDLSRYSVIVDCTDRWSSHDSVIGSGLRSGRTVVHGSIQGTLGRVMVFRPGGPCWRCLHPESPTGVRDGVRGTLGPVCGVIGSMMAMEAVKSVLAWDGPKDRMTVYNAADRSFSDFGMDVSPDCEFHGGMSHGVPHG